MLNSASFSDKFYSVYVSNNSKYTKNKLVSVQKVISLLPEKGKVVDLGCSDGFVLEEIRNKGSYEVYGLDASTKSVDISRGKGLNVSIADLEKPFPYSDNFFDAVIGLEIIEHLADTDFFVDEIKRVLKPGGCLILCTPNALSLPRRLLTLIGLNPFFEASFTYPPRMAGHLRFFTPAILKGHLESRGFKVNYLGSDLVNFSKNGILYSTFLAGIFPNLGRGIIIRATI